MRGTELGAREPKQTEYRDPNGARVGLTPVAGWRQPQRGKIRDSGLEAKQGTA